MIGKIIGGVGIVLGLTFAPALIVSLKGRALLYHPTKVTDSELSRLAFRGAWERAQLKVPKGGREAGDVTLQGLIRPSKDPKAPWLVFFGGNAMSIVSGQAVLDHTGGELGYGLAVFAYRSYDTSEGKPNQEALMADGDAIMAYLKDTWGAEARRVVLIGQSLGSGVATAVAASSEASGEAVGGLVLLSPYRSMRSVFASKVPLFPVAFALRDPYPTETIAPGVSAPVLLIHGDEDTLIPISHSEALLKAFPGPSELITIRGQGHNGLWQPVETAEGVRAFVAENLGE